MSPEDSYEVLLLQRRIQFLEKTDPIQHEARIAFHKGYLPLVHQEYAEINTRQKLLALLTDLDAKGLKEVA